MFPIGTDSPQRRTPWMNYAIIAACTVIYFISHRSNTPADPSGLGSAWLGLMLTPTHLRVYQFVTYQFLHAHLIRHLLGNMIFLWAFGNTLNDKLGHLPYLLFYIAGGVMAGCGQALTSGAPTLGASGSIAAVVGLFLVLLPLTNIRVWFLFGIFEIPSIWFIAFQIVFFDVLGEVLQTSDGVAHFAHLTGYLTGIVVGLVVLWANLVPRDHYDLLALVNRWRRRRQYQSLVAGGYNPFMHDKGTVTITPPAQVAATGAGTLAGASDPRIAGLRETVMNLRRDHQLAQAASAFLELRRMDPAQILPEDVQLDIGNQLMSGSRYPAAATTYEDYLRVYPRGGQVDQVQLILGLIYARYEAKPQRAIELFQKSLSQLHNPSQRALAESELANLRAAGYPIEPVPPT
jgi:membrane associated rhomboid family serine protease